MGKRGVLLVGKREVLLVGDEIPGGEEGGTPGGG